LGKLFAPVLIKVRAAAMLASIGDEEGRAALRGYLRRRREDVRGLVIQSLGDIGDEWATGLLRELRTSGDGEVLNEMIDDALTRVLRGGSR
jgi:HEAT repeat protein